MPFLTGLVVLPLAGALAIALVKDHDEALIRRIALGVSVAVFGVTLLVFSVIFPTVKLALMASSSVALAGGRGPGTLTKFAHNAGKFSMLDVFVVGLIVLAIKGLPGGSKVTLGRGVAAFAGSVVLSLIASLGLSMLERRGVSAAGAAATPASTDPLPGQG